MSRPTKGARQETNARDELIEEISKLMAATNTRGPQRNGDGISKIRVGDIVRTTEDISHANEATGTAKAAMQAQQRQYGVGIVANSRHTSISIAYWFLNGKRVRDRGAAASTLLPFPSITGTIVAMEVIKSTRTNEETLTLI